MLGDAAADALSCARVAIFGLGGVGGWCAESLARSGVRRMMLVDSDRITASNVNRQIMATAKTVGEAKVFALARRLEDIRPDIEIDAREEVYSEETATTFELSRFDYVIDAIDSLSEKAALIRHALAIPSVTIFSSMGAALKMDPTMVRVTDFRKVEGDGLARALRRRLRETGGIPERRFDCVWSPERRENLGVSSDPDDAIGWGARKARINGTVAHTTAVFGFILAGLVVQDVEHRIPSAAQNIRRS